jgi:GxxExxY protein
VALEHEELTGEILAAAVAVHRALGPGFIEAIYERALVVELRKRGLKVLQQVEIEVTYEGVVVGTHKLDLIVEDTIILELKAIKAFEDIHFAVLRSYLRAFGKEHGLLLNFGRPRLQAKRVISRPLED